MKCALRIAGNDYTVETDEGSEEGLKEAAAFVDLQLRKTTKETKTLDTNKIMIITLLEVASEYLSLKNKADSRVFDYEKEIKSFNSRLEETLK
ncbi:MAG: cell division protein ZapA [bacterium]